MTVTEGQTPEFVDLEYSVDEGVATILLNRPRYRNAQSRRMLRELDAAFERASADDDVLVIVLAGEGASFSSGHDLGTSDEKAESERHPIPTDVAGRSEWSWTHYGAPLLRWRDLSKPTIAAVHGHCIFAGWTLASAMDLVLVADDAVIIPHLSEYFSLPWDVGGRHAKEILFRGKAVTPEQAVRLGMANEVVPADQLRERASEIASEIAGSDAYMLRMIKSSVNAMVDAGGFKGSIRSSHAAHMLTYFDGSSRAADEDGSAKGKMKIVERAVSAAITDEAR